MRALYSLAMYLGTPLVLAYFFARSLREPAYRRRWAERFARQRTPRWTESIVVHAASMGEVNAAAPLVKALREHYPSLPLVVTTVTPTGSERVRALFGESVEHSYAPLDLPGAVRRFLERTAPRLVIVMETEVWPNLYAAAARRRIPLLLANACLSDASERAYHRWRRLSGPAFGSLAFAAAQTARDAERIVACGADPERVAVVGNLKLDMAVPGDIAGQAAQLRTQWGSQRPVLVAGSTHEADEAVLLEAFHKLLPLFPDALLILAPRHPERFARTARSVEAAGLRLWQRSQGAACPPEAQCFLIDSVGELLRYYACADVAFVGGTLAPIGGHNVIEPAALGKPVLVGPHTDAVDELLRPMLDAGGAARVRDAEDLARRLVELFGDQQARLDMGGAARALVETGRGTVRRTVDIASRLLARAGDAAGPAALNSESD